MKLKYLLAIALLPAASLFAVTETQAPSGPGYVAHIKTKSADVNDFTKLKSQYTPPSNFKVVLVSGDTIKAEHKKAGYPEVDIIAYYKEDGSKTAYVVVDNKGDISWKETQEFYKSVDQKK
jgi:hypothetical protein